MPVTHTDPQPFALPPDAFVKSRIVGGIGVPEHRVHRSNRRELVENVISADVAGVQNQLDSGQRIMNVRPELAVRVGNQTDEDRINLRPRGPSPSA